MPTLYLLRTGDGQMKDIVNIFKLILPLTRLWDITFYNIYFTIHKIQVLGPSGAEFIKHGNCITFLKKRTYQMTANETGDTGVEDGFVSLQ